MADTELKNRILIKRGATTEKEPTPLPYNDYHKNGLMPYELGWDTTQRQLYIGSINQTKETEVIPVGGSIIVSSSKPNRDGSLCLWIDISNDADKGVAKYWNNTTKTWEFVRAVWG